MKPPSDIHVFVRFQDQSVFAGEELKCTITFKNILDQYEAPTPTLHARRNSRTTSISKIAAAAARQPSAQADNRITRATSRQASLANAGLGLTGIGSSGSGDHSPQSAPDGSVQQTRPEQKHQRSISIISGGTPVVTQGQGLPPASGQRPSGNHRRSSTIQVVTGNQRRPSQYHREQSLGLHLQSQPGRRSPLSSTSPSTTAAASRRSTPDFQFPPQGQQDAEQRASREPSPRDSLPKAPSPRPGRDIATSSQAASERSSNDFYSFSNHSQETLMSEQPSVLSDRPEMPSSTSMIRRHYRMDSQQPRKPQAANLLMGYAHLNASFTVDGSLVDQSQFEEVKKKGFLGGQAGGGVVGVKKARPSSGFMSSFNFNSIGESLNNLVGADNMSSVKEMNAVANSRAVPLLSTPQSLLFVDLHLEPGEEKSYAFSCVLPRGLPSSYRGKSIKISYNVLIGVQGVPGRRDVHRVRQISIPVRVFSGVDGDGEVLGHDLMQPHVVLRDVARTKSIDPTKEQEKPVISTSKKSGNPDDFLKYVETLLGRNRRRQSSSGTMDPMAGATDAPDANSTVQAINRAILFSNRLSNSSESSSNRFEISRSGLRVAVVMIDRSLHRLGETVTAVIEFNDPDLPCASLHATLETTEKVESSLAVRSATSINRVTRRVYASHSDNVLFSKRTVFAPTIPPTATPTFMTSGMSLEWSLRLEFGTVRLIDQGDGELSHSPDLFEDVVKDERGIVSIAVERLECDTFEVVIPITVYGDVVKDSDDGSDGIGVPI